MCHLQEAKVGVGRVAFAHSSVPGPSWHPVQARAGIHADIAQKGAAIPLRPQQGHQTLWKGLRNPPLLTGLRPLGMYMLIHEISDVRFLQVPCLCTCIVPSGKELSQLRRPASLSSSPELTPLKAHVSTHQAMF